MVISILAVAGCSRTPSETANTAATPTPSTVAPAPTASAPTASAPPVSAAPVKPPPPPEPVTVSAPAGTRFRVRTISTLSTKTAQSGETFSAVLVDPLVVGGKTLARAGANVTGVVSNSDPGGRVKGVASIAVRASRLELANGQTADLVTNSQVRNAPKSKKKDALKIGIGSGVGAAIGAIAGGGKGAAIGAGAGAGAGTGVVMATRGEPAVIPSESLLTFTLRQPVTIVQ